MVSVQKAARLAAARLQKKLKERMNELWNDRDFRARLDDETAGIDKRNFQRYIRKAIKKSEGEEDGR